MTRKIEPTKESVVLTTKEIAPETVGTVVEETSLETAITVDKTVGNEEPKLNEAPEGEVGPTIPAKEGETFKEKLELGQITVGTKISYVVSGAEVPTEVIVDDAFLSLPIQNLEYYEKFNYKIV